MRSSHEDGKNSTGFSVLLQFNFVGRILGPRGMTAKQLEQETGCKIMVRGKGSMRDKKKVRNVQRLKTFKIYWAKASSLNCYTKEMKFLWRKFFFSAS